MSGVPDRVQQVRRVVAAGGGWNRRSRATLLAWARAERLSEAELARLLSKALGIRVSGARVVDAQPAPVAESRAPARARWWLAALALLGLASSALLATRLAQRVERLEVRQTEKARSSVPEAPEPIRKFPPPPIPFTQPPRLEAAESGAPAPEASTALGERPSGELSRLDLKRFGDAWRQAATAWPSVTPLDRAALLRDLAAWHAGCVSPQEARRLGEIRREAREANRDPRATLLAEALEAMLAAEIARSPQLSSAAAEALPSDVGATPADALQTWVRAQVPRLAAEYAAPSARERWSTWMQCVAALPDVRTRAACTLEALAAIVRSAAPIAQPGVPADAVGSLVATLPSRPDDDAFGEVRDAWCGWLADASLPSARLWALGGIWRARDPRIDVSLLPGERDAMTERRALATRWKAIEPAQAVVWWKPLRSLRERAVPDPDQPVDRRIDDLASRVHLLRRLALPGRTDDVASPMIVPAAMPASPPAVPRWSEGLLDRAPESRLRTLRVMQGAAPPSIAPVDAEALATRALSGPTADEITVAQDVIVGSLRESPVMRLALAHELAVGADPQASAAFLCEVVGARLPSDDSDALRTAAIGALLRGAGDASAPATARLAGELAAWQGSEAGREGADAGALAWRLANRCAREAASLRTPESVQPLVQGIEARARRLQALAPAGPRALAAALAVIADAEAARLAVRRLSDADVLRGIADGASRARASSPDALAQAAVSLDAIADMQLVVVGDAPASVPALRVRAATDAVAAGAALAEADAALARANPDPAVVRAALRRALERDASTAPGVALAMAQVAASSDARRAWLDVARLLGAGAMLGDEQAFAAREGLALAQVLAWAERGQADRLGLPRLGETQRTALEAFAASRGLAPEACLQALRVPRDSKHDSTLRALRARVAATLAGDSASWLDAFDGGRAGPVPEADAAQPWRLVLPQD